MLGGSTQSVRELNWLTELADPVLALEQLLSASGTCQPRDERDTRLSMDDLRHVLPPLVEDGVEEAGVSGRRQPQPDALDVFLTKSAFQVGHIGLRASDDARTRTVHGGERRARPNEPWHERCRVERNAQHRALAS